MVRAQPTSHKCLILEERVEAIRQYDIKPNYTKIARYFNCSVGQINHIIRDREAILGVYEMIRRNSDQPNSLDLHQRKIDFMELCVSEYFHRIKFYLSNDINDKKIRQKALEFKALIGIDNFLPNKVSYFALYPFSFLTIIVALHPQNWLSVFKSTKLFKRPIRTKNKPPRTLQMYEIMYYCGRFLFTSDSIDGSVPPAKKKRGTYAPRAPKPPPVETQHKYDKYSDFMNFNKASASSENDVQRKIKINFLEKALYEYITRLQFKENKLPLNFDHLRKVAMGLRDILKIENLIPDRAWFNHFKSHHNFSFSQGVPLTGRTVPQSLDLHEIISDCASESGASENMLLVDSPPEESSGEAFEVVKNEDDGLMTTEPIGIKIEESSYDMENSTEPIQIKVELEELENSTSPAKRSDLKRPLATDASAPSSFTIKKIESSNSIDLGATSLTESNYDSELSSVVNSYEDALRLLKLLDEFVLLEENYRAIGLLEQLEKIFEVGTSSTACKIKKEPLNSSESNFDHCVRSYGDAVRLLKSLEYFVLLEENDQAIGLVTKLEEIFQGGARDAE